MRKLLLLGLVFALAACRQAGAVLTPTPTLSAPAITSATHTPAPSPTGPVATVARPTPGAPATLTITAGDAAKLAAIYYPPVIVTQIAGEKAPAVLLLHMNGGSKADWDGLAKGLQAQGMGVLAIDFRGHGQSAGPVDWNKSVDDARLAWETLQAQPALDADRTAIVGASIGANIALIVGANNPVAAVAALSPGEDFAGIKPSGLLGNFGSRPVYLLASQDDSYSYTSAQKMMPLLAGGESFYYQNAGHGTAMFSNPDLSTRLLAWLGVQIGEPKG
jgi:pimeloyl-ACP methyl ester carboxylesterase